MPVLDEVLAANAEYAASFGAKASLALPPARGFAILTCMVARLDPAKYAGLSEGDAHVVRNAGGRASDDAIRSLVISYKLLGTREWFVNHHTNCGMLCSRRHGGVEGPEREVVVAGPPAGPALSADRRRSRRPAWSRPPAPAPRP
jgi:carbonic anhydrase